MSGRQKSTRKPSSEPPAGGRVSAVPSAPPEVPSSRRVTAPAGRPGPSDKPVAKGKHAAKDRKALLAAATDRLEVDYSSGQVDLQFSPGGTTGLAGVWGGRLLLAQGGELPLTGDWQPACWQSDKDGDYLELQLHPAEGVRVDRSLFISRDGGFSFLADAVVSEPGGPAVVALESRLQLAPGVTATGAAVSRERILKKKGLQVRVFPLGLPADAILLSDGSCDVVEGELRLSQACHQGNGWSPLLLDWNAGRRKKPALWKNLTVSESRVVVGPHQATASRWRCGEEHLLCYRALTAPEVARAVLGLHTWFETVVARITKPGVYQPLVQIETAE